MKCKDNKKFLFKILLLMLLSNVGCGRVQPKPETWEPPNTISNNDAWKLGQLKAWHPTGGWVFYRMSVTPHVLIYDVMTQKVEVINTPGINNEFAGIALSPNGDLIAYSSKKRAMWGYEKIIIYDLIHNEQILEVLGSDPAFSPNGEQISVWRSNELYIIALKTKEETLIYQISEEKTKNKSNWIMDSQWNPRGEKIAFQHVFLYEYEDDTTIYLVDIKSRTAESLVSEPSTQFHFSWSPDGRMLVFSSGLFEESTLSIIDIINDCTIDEISITDELSIDSAFWSPDGSSILYDISFQVKFLDIKSHFGVEYEELACEN